MKREARRRRKGPELWGGRFGKDTDALVNEFNAFDTFDQRLYAADNSWKHVHAEMWVIRESSEGDGRDHSGTERHTGGRGSGKIEFTPENETSI